MAGAFRADYLDRYMEYKRRTFVSEEVNIFGDGLRACVWACHCNGIEDQVFE